MITRKLIVSMTILTLSTVIMGASVVYAARTAGAYWSGFDSPDGLKSDLLSGYVVVDAMDPTNDGSGGLGPYLAGVPSFSDSEIILFDESDDEEDISAPVSQDSSSDGKAWKEIKVSAGDTLSKIAEAHGISTKDIMLANEIKNQHKITEGQTLFVPRTSSDVLATLDHIKSIRSDEISRKKHAKEVVVTNYIVKDGDTLWSIANAFDLDINSLFGCNKLTNADKLKVGTTIRIPNQDGLLVTVKQGQTVDSLAKDYSIYTEAIRSANRLTATDTLTAGKEIFLPGAKVIAFIETGGNKTAVAKRNTPNVKASVGFGWPVVGKISSPFAWRRDPIRGSRDFHTGLDIRAPRGRGIVASQSGKVVHSGWMGGYGKTIVIQHGNGITTLYAHCSSLIAKKGANVKKGQRIALVGSTGRSTGNHCHFEVRKNGTPVNPLKYLK